ncbi:MAG TPA: energy transducer TonB [Saprospiraceae bacterium]|jgi:protein TonB|nr:energy transducer TonB [Saprospiraceae bacterium]
MEIKKSKKARLDLHSRTFFLIGLAISLSVVFYAFEYKSETERMELPKSTTVIDWNEAVIENTERPQPKKIPKIVFSTPEIVDNNTKLPDEDIIVYSKDIDELDNIDYGDDEYEEYIEPFIEFPTEYPQFPGGDEAMQSFLKGNIHYPQMAIDYNSEGTVYVQFTVGANGKVRDVKVLRQADPLLEEEAIRVVESMPPWKPAKQGTISVATYMRIPIRFVLNH